MNLLRLLPTTLRPTLALLCGLALAACASPTYDQAAYANAVSVKVDACALMEKGTTSYDSHAAEIATVNRQIEKAYQYDLGRPLNHETMDMWDLILKINPAEPKSGIWPRFIALWKSSGKLSQDYVNENKQNLAEAFDTIIAYESGKPRPSTGLKP